jgi:hypothetical protein
VREWNPMIGETLGQSKLQVGGKLAQLAAGAWRDATEP